MRTHSELLPTACHLTCLTRCFRCCRYEHFDYSGKPLQRTDLLRTKTARRSGRAEEKRENGYESLGLSCCLEFLCRSVPVSLCLCLCLCVCLCLCLYGFLSLLP